MVNRRRSRGNTNRGGRRQPREYPVPRMRAMRMMASNAEIFKPVECPVCRRAFAKEHGYRIHYTKVHGLYESS